MSAQQSLVSPYRAPWWLPEGHSQTLWVDAAEAGAGSEQPIVFLLHGLCGSSLSPYIQSQQILLQQRAISSVAMNFRGCSGEINRRARAYHSGCTEDVEEVFQALRAQHPRRSFAFAGFSLGGNVLLKWRSRCLPHSP